jgi:hypothetical protein
LTAASDASLPVSEMTLQYEFSEKYRGFGFSTGLQRGLLVYRDGALLVEEGMGLGICAIQTGGFTYFSSVKESSDGDGCISAIFELDRKLVWRVCGIRSLVLTRIVEAIVTNSYMKLENKQDKMLRLSALLIRLFRVDASYLAAKPQGQVTVSWRTGPREIEVTVSGQMRRSGGKLFVMNELGGGFFHEAQMDGARTAPPTGWQKLTGRGVLICPAHNLAFSLEERQVPENVQSKLFWGREVAGQINWAGFESELTWTSDHFEGYRYAVKFREEAP